MSPDLLCPQLGSAWDSPKASSIRWSPPSTPPQGSWKGLHSEWAEELPKPQETFLCLAAVGRGLRLEAFYCCHNPAMWQSASDDRMERAASTPACLLTTSAQVSPADVILAITGIAGKSVGRLVSLSVDTAKAKAKASREGVPRQCHVHSRKIAAMAPGSVF